MVYKNLSVHYSNCLVKAKYNWDRNPFVRAIRNIFTFAILNCAMSQNADKQQASEKNDALFTGIDQTTP